MNYKDNDPNIDATNMEKKAFDAFCLPWPRKPLSDPPKGAKPGVRSSRSTKGTRTTRATRTTRHKKNPFPGWD